MQVISPNIVGAVQISRRGAFGRLLEKANQRLVDDWGGGVAGSGGGGGGAGLRGVTGAGGRRGGPSLAGAGAQVHQGGGGRVGVVGWGRGGWLQS